MHAIVVAWVLACAGLARAQSVQVPVAAGSAVDTWPRPAEPALPQIEVCRRAAATSWASEGGNDAIRCRLERTSEPGLAVLVVESRFSIHAFAALLEHGGLRVVAEIDRQPTHPGVHVELHVSSVRRTHGRDAEALAIETRASYLDREGHRGFASERRHLAVCAHPPDGIQSLRCTLEVPLELVARTLERPARVLQTARTRAVAVVRRDGTLRLRLREGNWSLLWESERPATFPPSAEENEVVLRWDGRDE